jgi:hypothetical protein
VAPEALVGSVQGLPVLLDANLPTNRGTGTNEDVALVVRTADLFLFEENSGPPRLRVLQEVLSGVLGVRLQAYSYAAFTAQRHPGSVSVISGTGMVTPVL